MFGIMNMIRALFTKKTKAAQSVRPPWNEIVEFMRDKGLELEGGERLVKTLFGANGEMRLIIGIHSFRPELIDASLRHEYMLEQELFVLKISKFKDLFESWALINTYS